MKLSILVFITTLMYGLVTAQLSNVINEVITGPTAIVKGVKNIMGGMLAADSVHKKCLQKTLCNEFSREIVEAAAEVDPVKRTIVYVPKVVQRRGRLRFIGDAIANGIKHVANRLGLNPYGFNRRQGLPPTLAQKAVQFVAANWEKIPTKEVIHLMDLGADMTSNFLMEKKGAVYPYVRSSILGYSYGHVKDDDFDGVCTQIAPDCGSWWDHLEIANNYDAGALNRKVEREYLAKNTRSGQLDPDDPMMWNNIQADHVMKPKVFLCKASKFLQKMYKTMGGDDDEVVRQKFEKFGPEEFQDTCDPRYLDTDVSNAHSVIETAASADSADNANIDGGVLGIDEIEIIEARDTENNTLSPLFNETDHFEGLPILVFEGLPTPQVDQTEEELVESLMKLVNVPNKAVRTAVRLPLRTRGRSITLVEMENEEEEEEVLKNKDKIRKFRSPLVKVGIRRAKYKELWKFVRQMIVVKEIQNAQQTEEALNVIPDQDIADANQKPEQAPDSPPKPVQAQIEEGEDSQTEATPAQDQDEDSQTEETPAHNQEEEQEQQTEAPVWEPPEIIEADGEGEGVIDYDDDTVLDVEKNNPK